MSSKKTFKSKYSFLEQILSIVFSYDIKIVELFISDVEFTELKDFDTVHCNANDFLDVFYNSLINNYATFNNQMYFLGFPNAKFEIVK